MLHSAATAPATAAPPQAAMPMLPPLPPLLKQWQQQWQHSIVASGWRVVAATAAEMILLCRHRRGGYCCPARGCHTNHNRDFSKNDYISNVKMTVTDIGTTSATTIYAHSSCFKLLIWGIGAQFSLIYHTPSMLEVDHDSVGGLRNVLSAHYSK